MLYTVDMIEKWVKKDPDGLKGHKFDIIGVLLHVQNIRLVGWKEEEIISLSNGKNVLLDVSFWKTHEEPKGTNSNGDDSYKGRIILVKNVEILNVIEKREDRFQLYGSIKVDPYQKRHIIFLIMNDCDIKKFEENLSPFRIDDARSIIPDYVKGKRAGKFFPILEADFKAVKQVLTHHKWYKKCLNTGIVKTYTYLTMTILRRGRARLEKHEKANGSMNDITTAMSKLVIKE